MQAEIVAEGSREERNIQVVEVNRTTLPTLSQWPAPPQAHMPHSSWPRGGQGSSASTEIAPGDLLTVTIWDNEENSLLTTPAQKSVQLTDVAVGQDGNVFLPYVGAVKVRGLSPDKARERLQTTLSEALPSAQVLLSVRQGRTNTVDLVGGVAKAGSYPLTDRSLTVLSLISQAGGVNSNLANPIVKLVRGGRVYGISVNRLFEQPSLDLALRGGDKIIVEDDSRKFLALGATGKQSSVPFPQDKVSALDAVTLIGGLSATRADPKGVLILREYAAKQVRQDGLGPDRTQVVFALDLTSADGLFSAGNFAVQNGDVVLATESPVTSARTVFGLVGQIFGLANQVDG